jgi:autotransporter-associated beta strand protein
MGNISLSAVEAIELNTDVTSTGGTVSFNSPVILTGTSSATNNGAITFQSTVDGANDLTVNAGTGTTTFQAAVGSTTPIGDGVGAALRIAGGAATFNGTVETASGIVQDATAGLVTFNEDVTVTGGDTASNFAGNVTLDGLTFQTIDQDASFTGSTLTLAGSGGVTLRVGGTSAHTITVGAQVVGPVATDLNIWTNPASAVILNNADNTYAGVTNINNGRLTVHGQLSATGSPSTVTLVGPDTVLDGSGTLRERSVVVASTANNASILGVSIQGAGMGTGIGVRVDSSRANLGGNASGVGVDSLTIQGWNIGVQVNGASARAALVGLAGDRNVITHNRIGVDVNAGRALIERTDLSNNTRSGMTDGSWAAGLRVRNNARVDAGQGFGGFDFTELGTGGVGGGSEGDNVFDGYTTYTGSTLPTVPQAILNLSNTGLNAVAGPQGAPTDVYAQYNTFNGSTALPSIEPLVWHDYDSSARGFVNYARPSSLTPTTVGNVRLIAGTDSALQTNNYTQASMVRIARVSFDNYVSIDMSATNPADRALVITRVGSAFNATAINTSVTTVNAQTGAIRFDPFSPEGRYFNYDLTFSGPGVELSGSLQDGDYTLSFDGSKVQSFVNLTPPGQNVPGLQGGSGIQTLQFHRLFGDVDGNRVVNSVDQAFLNATMRSRRGMANFYEYLNFDWNSVIDTQDQTAFNRRFNRY